MKAQVAVAALLLVLMVFLLVMSSRTGHDRFDQAKQRLEDLEALNVRMDGAIFLLMFELQTDFDQLTALQGEMRAAAREVAPALPNAGQGILEPVQRKLVLVEDFKSQQAVFRNSRAIAAQMIAELWSEPAARAAGADADLFEVERALLDFVGRRDAPSAARLDSVLRAASLRGGPLTATAQWGSLAAHAGTLIDYADRLSRLAQSQIFYDVPVALFEESERLGEQLATSSAAAARYRGMLFIVAVLLLAFSALMAARVRRYVQLIAQANNELEERVRARTEELANVNAALRQEIAEREHVESQLRIAQKLEAIGQLAAGIAHEINTPAQYVSDNVSFLASVWRDLEPLLADYERNVLGGQRDERRSRELWSRANVPFVRDEVPAAIEQSLSGLQQIGSIVLAVKNFSHPGVSGLRPANLNAAIESTTTIARTHWKNVAELELELDPALPPVPCNVSAFNQVVLNLLVNAAQAIAADRKGAGLGSIRIASARTADHVEVRVEDDGPGVPPEIRDRIFDPFFTTKEVGEGTGQGLAISLRVIHQLHGGTLTLEEPAAGTGARFVIRLPLESARLVPEPVPERQAEVA